MKSIGEGARLSILECQHQFRRNKWNCSTVSSGQDSFGKIVQRGECMNFNLLIYLLVYYIDVLLNLVWKNGYSKKGVCSVAKIRK